MTALPHSAFYVRKGEQFIATPLTRGPWDNRLQHAGPPCALLGGAIARAGDQAEQWAVATLTYAILRPVPIGTLTLAVSIDHDGRKAQRLSAALSCDGRVCITAQALRLRKQPIADANAPPVDAWPEPETLPTFTFDFFQHPIGYHIAVDVRLAHGSWGRTPIGFWTRPRVPLIDGQVASPLERLLIIADAQSGLGVPLSPSAYTFVNPDLTVHLARHPQGEWLGFDIRAMAGGQGAGLATSSIRDATGELGRSAQTLLVSPR